MSRCPRIVPATPLQEALHAIFDALHDAREACSDDEYRALLTIVQEHLTREHLRVAAGDLERTRRAG